MSWISNDIQDNNQRAGFYYPKANDLDKRKIYVYPFGLLQTSSNKVLSFNKVGKFKINPYLYQMKISVEAVKDYIKKNPTKNNIVFNILW